MSNETWQKDMNYWENPECPREYLENALLGLIHFVEDVHVDRSLIEEMSDEKLREQLEFYEYLSEK